ncbi:hypothetical protein [Photobacterium galatheae]|nr:hypothetical protein [Photobacterium galatheae]MCM0149023.1 hypothetical protein [Photobacterium galatheae]
MKFAMCQEVASRQGSCTILAVGLGMANFLRARSICPESNWVYYPSHLGASLAKRKIVSSEGACSFCVVGHSEPAWVYDLALEFNIPIWRISDHFLGDLLSVLGLSNRISSLLMEQGGHCHYESSGESELIQYIAGVRYSNEQIDEAFGVLSALQALFRKNRVAPQSGAEFTLVIGENETSDQVRFGGQRHHHFSFLMSVKRELECTQVVFVDDSQHHNGRFESELLMSLVDQYRSQHYLLQALFSARLVCVLTSELGILGLLEGKEVHTFGTPFYSGFGLTVDHCPGKRRLNLVDLYGCKNRALAHLIRAALIEAPAYFCKRGRKPLSQKQLIDIFSERDF